MINSESINVKKKKKLKYSLKNIHTQKKLNIHKTETKLKQIKT